MSPLKRCPTHQVLLIPSRRPGPDPCPVCEPDHPVVIRGKAERRARYGDVLEGYETDQAAFQGENPFREDTE